MELYQYTKRRCILTDTEREFFSYLMEAVGDKYTIFPQVHIDMLAEAQGWRNLRFKAWAHISRKSVDFILTDPNKGYETVCAIELNDKTHFKRSRRFRDAEVRKILESINIPLITIEVSSSYSVSALKRQIEVYVK